MTSRAPLRNPGCLTEPVTDLQCQAGSQVATPVPSTSPSEIRIPDAGIIPQPACRAFPAPRCPPPADTHGRPGAAPGALCSASRIVISGRAIPRRLVDRLHQDRGQSQRRLVQHHQRRSTHQGAGDGQHLLLAAGEGRGVLNHVRRGGNSSNIASMLSAAARRRDSRPSEVLGHRHVAEHPAALRQQSHPEAAR